MPNEDGQHSLKAEESVISLVIKNPKCIEDVILSLSPTDFFSSDTRAIYTLVCQMYDDGIDIEPVSVGERSRNLMEDSHAYLERINKTEATLQNLNSYMDTVKKYSICREVIEKCSLMMSLARNGDIADIEQSISDTRKSLGDLSVRSTKNSIDSISIKETLEAVSDQISQNSSNETGIVGLSSGFSGIDRLISGLQKTELIILAGRPSMGKTTLAFNICENIVYAGKTALVFSLEMSATSLAYRLLASRKNLNQSAIRCGGLSKEVIGDIDDAMKDLAKTKLFIDDTSALSIGELTNRAKKYAKEEKPDLIVVDYIQLMKGSKQGSNVNRTTEVTEISMGLKSLAKDLDVPVIALSQLNRDLEKRNNKRPIMADLRDSGSIEQDADAILFIYRDEVYDPNSVYKGTAEILARKVRNGSVGQSVVIFNGESSKFVDMTDEEERIFNSDLASGYARE